MNTMTSLLRRHARGVYAKDASGKARNWDDPCAVSFCLAGALHRVLQERGLENLYPVVASRVARFIDGGVSSNLTDQETIIEFNDARTTQAGDLHKVAVYVDRVIDACQELVDACQE